MRTIQFTLDTDEAEELQIAQELALEMHSAKPSPKALFLAGLRNPPSILKLDVDAETRKAWDVVCGRQEFKYMPPVGVLNALLRAYTETHMAPTETAGAEAVAKDSISGADRRLMRIKMWAKMPIETRMGNTLEFMKYADPALVDRFGDEFTALNHEALDYE
jgi:hypothetical protein